MYILQKYIIPKKLRNLLLDIWAAARSLRARVRVTQIFPRKTCQPVTIGVIRLYIRRLTSDGFEPQTRH